MPSEVLAVQSLTIAHPWSALDGCNCAQVINQRDGVINRSVSETAAAGGVLGIYVVKPFDEILGCSMTCRGLKSTFRFNCTLVTKLQPRQMLADSKAVAKWRNGMQQARLALSPSAHKEDL
jgi:hypothetical protein